MDRNKDFTNSCWVGVPESLYEGKTWNGRIETQTAYYRNEFDLSEAGKLVMHISASSRYRLYINGKSILSGPCKGDRWRHFYESIDVSEHLVIGKNLIAVKVVAFPPYEAQHENGDGQGPLFSNNSASGPCLVVSGIVTDNNGLKLANVNTGESKWMVCLDHAIDWETPHISFWMGVMEIVHGERLPFGWEHSSAPCGKWAAVERRWPTQPDSYGQVFPFPLTKRTIPFLYEKPINFTREMLLKENDLPGFSFESNNKTTIPPNKKVIVELDSGVLTTSYISIGIIGGKGAKIILTYAEAYSPEDDPNVNMSDDVINPADAVWQPERGRRDDSINFSLIGHQDVYYPSGGEETYTPFWFRTFRFVRLEIHTGAEEITIEKPVIIETGYPLEFITQFQSSDKDLEKIWEISKNTLQSCMHETHEDCPYYEQMQYIMDTRLQMLFTYALCGDTRMALRTIEDYHFSMMPDGMLQSRYPTQLPQAIPVFALHWIFMLDDYYEQTGDISIARRYRPTVDAVLDFYERHIGREGLVEHMPYWQQIDWVEEWEANAGMPNACLVGPSAVYNLEYAYTMQIAAKLNRLTGREECAKDYEKKAETILRKVDKACWNEKTGLFMEGPGFDEYSQHAQVFAVLTGLATDEKAISILTKALEQEGMLKCSFPLMFYFIRALQKINMYGRVTEFFDVLKSFINLNVTTIPETPFSPRSECHAWGSFALYEFPRSLLGVKPGTPGWEKILIKPEFIDINDCSGTVYTPKGNVEIAWEKINDSVRIYGNAPENIECDIILPNGHHEILEKGGRFDITIPVS